MSGFVKAQRDRFDHPMFRREKFCRGYAWDWLVAHAAFRDHQIDVKGQTVIVRRGQLCHSIRFLADRWNWDKAAVSRFLTRLKTEAMIETATEAQQTVITICNYERYQGEAGLDRDSNRDSNRDETETAARQQRDKEEEGKEGREGKEERKKAQPVAAEVVRVLSEVVPEPLARSMVDHRKSIKAPMTEQAARLMVAKLSKMPDPAACIEQSILNGWRGVFPSRQETQQKQRPQPGDTRVTPSGVKQVFDGGFSGWVETVE